MHLDARIADHAARRHGIVTTSQARSLGLTRSQIHRRVATGRWTRLHRGTFHVAGTPLSWKGALVAACSSVGSTAAASHRSAAALWRLPGATRSIPEITCERWGRVHDTGIRVHEQKWLSPEDVTTVDSVPVTSPELTLLHLAAVRTPNLVEKAYEQARNRGS